MDIIFVQFEHSHKDYVWQAYVNSMKFHIQRIWGWDEVWQKDNFLKSLDTYLTFILEVDSKKIGYVQFRHDEEITYLSMIVLENEFQSKGYGSLIIDKIHTLKPELPLKLRCFKVNERAYKFYLNNNFNLIDSDSEFHTFQRN